MKREVRLHVERRNSMGDDSTKEGSEIGGNNNIVSPPEDDTSPLKAEDREREAREKAQRTGVERGMGVYTKVFV